MTETSSSEEALRQRVVRGELSAHDELGTLLYQKGSYAEAADHYLKAYVGGYYKSNERPESSQNLYRMYENNWIPPNSDAYRLFQHLRSEGAATQTRTTNAATLVAMAVFVGYLALVYVGGIQGFLRDFSLIIAGGLAWFSWKLALSGSKE